MKVTLIIDSFPPYTSGVTTHYIILAIELLKRGHSVLILTPKPIKKPTIPQELKDATIIFAPSFKARGVKGFTIAFPNTPKATLAISRFKPDIIETSSPSFLGIDALIASEILMVPSVSYFYTLLTSEEYLKLLIDVKRIKHLERVSWAYHRWFYNNSFAVFTPTVGVKQILIDHGVMSKKIFVAPALTDLRGIRNKNSNQIKIIKKKLKLKKNVAVYLGRLSKEKKLDMLLDVWSIVSNIKPDSTLLIIGDGNYKTCIENKIKKLKLKGNVVLTGEIKHEELINDAYLHAADVYISTSTSETFGLAALEAMAHGLPVVLAKSQGLCEYTDKSGIICEPNDVGSFVKALFNLFENAKLRKDMGKNAKELSRVFDYKVGVNKTINLYGAVIKEYKKSLKNKKRATLRAKIRSSTRTVKKRLLRLNR